jgi:AraC-like DNA-binding protein
MFYRQYKPQPPLEAFIGCIWYSEGFEGSHERERLLPNGESAIIFDLRKEPMRIYDGQNPNLISPDPRSPARHKSFAQAIFSGARTDCFIIETSQQERVIGIQFQPGGAFPFLNMPAGEVANDTFALDDIWPGEAAHLHDALMGACSVEAMFTIVERALLARLRDTQALHPAIAFAIGRLARPAATIRIGDLAERVGFSSRRFIELFRDQTGLTPKSFQRVRRFQRVLKTLRAGSEDNWTSLAYQSGYYDQAHFIHDFRLFAGMTPGEYVTVATPHLNHVPLK